MISDRFRNLLSELVSLADEVEKRVDGLPAVITLIDELNKNLLARDPAPMQLETYDEFLSSFVYDRRDSRAAVSYYIFTTIVLSLLMKAAAASGDPDIVVARLLATLTSLASALCRSCRMLIEALLEYARELKSRGTDVNMLVDLNIALSSTVDDLDETFTKLFYMFQTLYGYKCEGKAQVLHA